MSNHRIFSFRILHSYLNKRKFSIQTENKSFKGVFRVMNAAVEKDETFNKNCDQYKKLVEKHSEMLTIAHAGGGEKAMLRHQKQNKMLVMDRIKALLDDDSEFFEVATLGGLWMEYGNVPRASIIGGIHLTENCLFISEY